jgi:hypothetical protein
LHIEPSDYAKNPRGYTLLEKAEDLFRWVRGTGVGVCSQHTLYLVPVSILHPNGCRNGVNDVFSGTM